jgi:hypothetical protein
VSKGWISKRHMQTGRGLNPNPSNNGSGNGPLRKVVRPVLVYSENNMFSRDKYLLECGHEVYGTIGAARVRCWKCKREQEQGKP